jgi:hypothetical protein
MCGQDWAPHRGQPGGPFHFPWKITENPRGKSRGKNPKKLVGGLEHIFSHSVGNHNHGTKYGYYIVLKNWLVVWNHGIL